MFCLIYDVINLNISLNSKNIQHLSEIKDSKYERKLSFDLFVLIGALTSSSSYQWCCFILFFFIMKKNNKINIENLSTW